MATETFSNAAFTTLNGSINNSTTSITVTSATGFPSSAQYRITVDSEIMLVTGGAGTTTWTVTRGAESTSAVSHSSGAQVVQTITVGGLNQTLADRDSSGSLASQPSAGVAGSLYWTNNSFTVSRDNGSSWENYGPIYSLSSSVPTSTGGPSSTKFGWVNQNSATLNTTNGGIYLFCPQNSADSWTMLVKSAPSTPYTLTAYLQSAFININYTGFGLVLRNSSSGNWIGFLQYCNTGALHLAVGHGTNTGPSITTLDSDTVVAQVYNWFSISDNGTTRTYYFSTDGNNWFNFYSQASSTPITPDQIGFAAESRNASYGIGVTLLSWTD